MEFWGIRSSASYLRLQTEKCCTHELNKLTAVCIQSTNYESCCQIKTLWLSRFQSTATVGWANSCTFWEQFSLFHLTHFFPPLNTSLFWWPKIQTSSLCEWLTFSEFNTYSSDEYQKISMTVLFVETKLLRYFRKIIDELSSDTVFQWDTIQINRGVREQFSKQLLRE